VDPITKIIMLSDLTGASVVFYYDTSVKAIKAWRKETAMAQLPRPFQRFTRNNPAVARAYENLGDACAKAGPLDARTRELVKLGLAIGARSEGAVHSHARRALEAGAIPAQIRHVVVLAAPTLGFPTAVAAFTWVEDVLSARRKRTR
jgi:4-carboxymuconolactone decarboxylase